MRVTESKARAVLEEAHLAWSAGDLDGTLACYVDDLRYVCNTGGFDGSPMCISGKNQFRDFLAPVMEAVDSHSTVSQFKLQQDSARAFIDCTLRHRSTGLQLVGNYTQIVTFASGKIMLMEELHDVARIAAFWSLRLERGRRAGCHDFRSASGLHRGEITMARPVAETLGISLASRGIADESICPC